MWADNETFEDLLGFQVHADLIRSVVLNPKLLPVTIGVFGTGAAASPASWRCSSGIWNQKPSPTLKSRSNWKPSPENRGPGPQ
jgi:hypothetical protein